MKHVSFSLVLVASLLVAHQVRAESWSKQLTPKMTGDDSCKVTVKVDRLEESGVGEFLDFHVRVKSFDSKDLPNRSGILRVFSGKEFVSSCRLQPTGSNGDRSFSFRIAAKYAEKSTFTYAQTGESDYISHWFYLKYFVESQ